MIEISIFILSPAAAPVVWWTRNELEPCLNCRASSIEYRAKWWIEVRLDSRVQTRHRNLSSEFMMMKNFQICSCCRLLFCDICYSCSPKIPLSLVPMYQITNASFAIAIDIVGGRIHTELSRLPGSFSFVCTRFYVFQIENRFLLEINLLLHSKYKVVITCEAIFGFELSTWSEFIPHIVTTTQPSL